MKKIILFIVLVVTSVSSTLSSDYADAGDYYESDESGEYYDDFDAIADDLSECGIEPTMPEKVSAVEAALRTFGVDLLMKLMAFKEYVGTSWQHIRQFLTQKANNYGNR